MEIAPQPGTKPESRSGIGRQRGGKNRKPVCEARAAVVWRPARFAEVQTTGVGAAPAPCRPADNACRSPPSLAEPHTTLADPGTRLQAARNGGLWRPSPFAKCKQRRFGAGAARLQSAHNVAAPARRGADPQTRPVRPMQTAPDRQTTPIGPAADAASPLSAVIARTPQSPATATADGQRPQALCPRAATLRAAKAAAGQRPAWAASSVLISCWKLRGIERGPRTAAKVACAARPCGDGLSLHRG